MFEKITYDEFEEVFGIMDENFPEDEKRPYEEQKELLNVSNYEIYAKKDGNIKGFAAVWNFDEILFIEHLAVKKEEQKKGIGSQILDDVKRTFKKRICLEVEPPRDEVSKKRIEFYKRNEFFLNEYEYMQPSISKGRKPVELMIMTTKGLVTEEEFKRIKEILYTKVYKVYS